MAWCQGVTRKDKQCINGKAEFDPVSGLFLCHLHHPTARFRQQVDAKRRAHQKERSVLRMPFRSRRGGLACAHCGGLYTRARHEEVCIKFGLAVRKVTP